MNDSEIQAFHSSKIAELPPEIRTKMVGFLRGFISEMDKGAIRVAIGNNQETWWAKYHHGWGTAIRNALRQNGFGETELGIENLDDYYIPLVEEAVLDKVGTSPVAQQPTRFAESVRETEPLPDFKKSPDNCPACGAHGTFYDFRDGLIKFTCGTECRRTEAGWTDWVPSCKRSFDFSVRLRAMTKSKGIDLNAIQKRLDGATPTPSESTPDNEVWMIKHLMEIVQAYRQDVPGLLKLCRSQAARISELEAEAALHYHDMQAMMGARNVAQGEADHLRQRVAKLEGEDADGVEYWRGEHLAQCDELKKAKADLRPLNDQVESVSAQLESARVTIASVAEALGCGEYQVVNVAEHLKYRVTDLLSSMESLDRDLQDANRKKQLAEKDAEGLKGELKMYQTAWIRELGGQIFTKTHLIDALVLTTRQIRESEKKAVARVAELETELTRHRSNTVWVASELEREKLREAIKTLANHVNKLKDELGDHGDYTITRRDGGSIDLIEAIRLGGILDRIDKSIAEPMPTAPGFYPESGIALIAQERIRHVDGEGWTPEHDDQHTKSELALAAACYIVQPLPDARLNVPLLWPNTWDWKWFKPKRDPVRNLVVAGSLIAAEIDRLLRQKRAMETSNV